MDEVRNANWPLGLLGAVAGGALGYFGFFFLARYGLYAIVLPGALVGLGCGGLSGGKSNLLGILCGLSGLLLGVFVDWRAGPFGVDPSLWFFVTHLHELPPDLVLIALGGLCGFWFGRGREGGMWGRTGRAAIPKE
jgi:hypothetical protein